ncbi:HAD family hydrolase [Amycolatopsis sp. SID8362]|uniref:HAD family hydrolase n=1 Tax=Amycolatopsis sp. SID8362 TaxID=2690346 RepID=UPI0013696E5B|nr:HAD family hydrolase [Amycolatopsis sp. SID8362]NBH02293.1 HAD family hydrolase [Amycolatopsis sp. SID8362]NED38996.1 HAD family hydrolase [Amycolatopsis sp. SID8362]
MTLEKLRVVALDCDGVLIDDTYLAMIARFVTAHGGVYDAAAERDVIGLRDIVVAEKVTALCGLDQPAEETLKQLWAARQEYLAEHPIRVAEGARECLEALSKLPVRLVCYGGRTREHTFDRYLGDFVDLLDPEVPYVSINEHRPGVAHITRTALGAGFDEIVFVDDVSRVAEDARAHGAGFIGFPSSPAHARQRDFMAGYGVRHFAASLTELTPELLETVDAELATSTHWPR